LACRIPAPKKRPTCDPIRAAIAVFPVPAKNGASEQVASRVSPPRDTCCDMAFNAIGQQSRLSRPPVFRRPRQGRICSPSCERTGGDFRSGRSTIAGGLLTVAFGPLGIVSQQVFAGRSSRTASPRNSKRSLSHNGPLRRMSSPQRSRSSGTAALCVSRVPA